ncbi:MAG: protein-L-isoaspartate O-methyltransferase [Thermoplasmatales archaeon]
MTLWGNILRQDGYLHWERHIRAFNDVKREDFLEGRYRDYASVDEPMPLRHGQTQSAPHMDAIFVDAVDPGPDDIILEIGTGSGYLTAILSLLCRRVISVEYYCDLAHAAAKNIARYGTDNVDLICGNINSICLRENFDAIISTSSFRREPHFLLSILKQEGIFIFPLGSYPPQELIAIRGGTRTKLGMVSFVTIID